MAINQSVAPAAEVLSTAEAKSHLKVTSSDEDTLIDSYVAAARVWCETFTGRQFVTATWELVLDRFPGDEILIPWAPLQSVSSIAYTDANGDAQTVATSVYTVDTKSVPGQVYLAYGQSWPSTQAIRNAVTVTFVAGYGAASAVPENIRTAVRLLVGHYYEHRGDEVAAPQVVKDILWQYRVFGVPISSEAMI